MGDGIQCLNKVIESYMYYTLVHITHAHVWLFWLSALCFPQKEKMLKTTTKHKLTAGSSLCSIDMHRVMVHLESLLSTKEAQELHKVIAKSTSSFLHASNSPSAPLGNSMNYAKSMNQNYKKNNVI